MSVQKLTPIEDRSHVGAARRCAAQMAEVLGFGTDAGGRLALCVTELATNILKHAGTGKILLRPFARAGELAIEALALDRGPGITDVAASLRDGHSTAGGMGTGLGALARASEAFEVYSQAGSGTAVRLEVWRGRAPMPDVIEYGGVSMPLAGEAVGGDDWAVQGAGSTRSLLVVDGLGHGPLAAQAARAALVTFERSAGAAPGALLERCHGALARTRGAAAAAAVVEPGQGRGTFAGIGNIGARVHAGTLQQHLISHGGTVGHVVRRIQEFPFDFPVGALLILYSDGLASRWSLDDYPALASRHPGLIAGVLYRDRDRGADDVTVVVLKNRMH